MESAVLVPRDALAADGPELPVTDADLSACLQGAISDKPADIAMFRAALTHSSHAGASYQRLEFLGDRVLKPTTTSSA